MKANDKKKLMAIFMAGTMFLVVFVVAAAWIAENL